MTSINPKLPIQNPEIILKGLSRFPKKNSLKQPSSINTLIEGLTKKLNGQNLLHQNRKWIPTAKTTLATTVLSGVGYWGYKYFEAEPIPNMITSAGNTLKTIAFVGVSILGVYFAKKGTTTASSAVNHSSDAERFQKTTNLKNLINSYSETNKNLNSTETHNYRISLLDSLKELLKTDQLDITLLFSDLTDEEGAELVENEFAPLIFNQLTSDYKSTNDKNPSICKILEFFEKLHTTNKRLSKSIFENFYLIFLEMIESLLNDGENKQLVIRACDLINTMIIDELNIFINNPELPSKEFNHIVSMITPYMYASKKLKFYENFIHKYPEQAWKFAMLFLDQNIEYQSDHLSFAHIRTTNNWPRTSLGNRIRSDAIDCTFSNTKDDFAFNFTLNYILAKLKIGEDDFNKKYSESFKFIKSTYKKICNKSKLESSNNNLKKINNIIINEMLKIALKIHQITTPSKEDDQLVIKDNNQNMISLEYDNENILKITNS
jgi:hypothetical protein